MHKVWRVAIVIIFCLALSGCRYLSLYRFGKQFCDFSEHVIVNQSASKVQVEFVEPVLPRYVFQRYLSAEAFRSVTQKYLVSEDYYFSSSNSERRYSFSVEYSTGLSEPLLNSGELDSGLSKLFSKAFVEGVLSSVCSEDYDLSSKELDFRMVLNAVSENDRPNLANAIMVLGDPESRDSAASTTTLNYRFHFIRNDTSTQSKLIQLNMTFQKDTGVMSQFYVQYHKYTLWLDFRTSKARLHVDRTK